MRVILRYLWDLSLRFTRTLDLMMLAALLALMVIGLAVLYSAGEHSTRMVFAQGSRFAVGLAAMWGLSRMSMPQLRNWTPVIYAVSMIPLLAVLVVGTGKHGRHWIDLKVFYFQPAELLKLSPDVVVKWIDVDYDYDSWHAWGFRGVTQGGELLYGGIIEGGDLAEYMEED